MTSANQRLTKDPVLLMTVVLTSIAVVIFIVYPIYKVFLESFLIGGAFSLERYVSALSKSYVRQPFLNSIALASVVGGLGTVIGFGLAYAVECARVPGRSVFDVFSTIPIVAPPFIIAIATIMLFGRNGKLTPLPIYGFWGLVITETLAYFPTAYLVLKGVLRSIHPTFEEAARNLGASRAYTFWRVVLPLAVPGIASAFLLVFIESLADFGNPLILAGKFQVLSVQAYLEITAIYDTGGGAVLAILLLFPSMIAYVVQKYVLSARSYVTVVGKQSRALRRSNILTITHGFILCVAVSVIVLTFYGSILTGAFMKLWGIDSSVTLANFKRGFEMGGQYILDSVLIAAASAPITGIMGLLIAYLVGTKRFFGRRFLEFASLLAFAVPGTVIGMGYIMAFNQPHWFMPCILQGTGWIILALFVFRNIPAGIEAGTAGLAQIDPSIEEAARTLGAGSLTVFRKVILPLLAPAFFSGLVFSFVRAMTQISAVIFVVSGKWNLLTVFLLGLVENGELSIAAAMSIVLVLIVLAALGVLKFILHWWQVRLLVKAAW